jgi:hypothetical protein
LGEAIKEKDFSRHTFGNLSFEFWKRYRPTINRKKREGISEVKQKGRASGPPFR